MSETRKNRDTASRATREASEQGAETVRQGAEEFRDMGETIADTMVKTTDAAVEMGQRVAEQGRETVLLSVRAAAGLGSRLADAGDGRRHRMLGTAARALQAWQEAGDSTAEHLQALFSSYLTVSHGMQQMQHVWLDLLDRSVDRAAHRPQDLLRCKSLDEFAQMQRDLYLAAVDHAMESSMTLLQLAAQTAQQAMRPLHGRAGNGAARG